MTTLTATAFEKFLLRLDPDPEQAVEKYELLRQKIVKALTWKGCPESYADALADTTLDRVAMKIDGGEEVQNLMAYSREVMRFVWLEQLRKLKEVAVGDDIPEGMVMPDIEILKDPDLRMRCLNNCLAEKVSDPKDRRLITGYYGTENESILISVRKKLAEELGMTMNLLKVKAFRIRERLEKCINECVERLSVTKSADSVTGKQGGDAR